MVEQLWQIVGLIAIVATAALVAGSGVANATVVAPVGLVYVNDLGPALFTATAGSVNALRVDQAGDRVLFHDTGGGLVQRDSIRGRSGDDRIDLRDGRSGGNIFGDGGNDVAYGSSGADIIYTGDGDDVVSGGAGADYVRSGGGDDRVSGGTGTTRRLVRPAATPSRAETARTASTPGPAPTSTPTAVVAGTRAAGPTRQGSPARSDPWPAAEVEVPFQR